MRKCSFVLLFICVLAFAPFCFISREYINHSVMNSWVITACGIVFFRREYIEKKILKYISRNIAASLITCCIILFLCPFWDVLKMVFNEEPSNMLIIWMLMIYMPVFVFNCYMVSAKIINYFTESIPDSEPVMEKKVNIYGIFDNKWISFVIITLISCIFLFSTYPGLFISDDANWVWTHLDFDNMLNDHTFGYTLFVKLCSTLHLGMFSVNICQTVIWLLINLYILDALEHYSKKSLCLYTVLISICVTPYLYLEIMYKDTIFSMGFLALTAGIWKVIRQEKILIIDGIILGFATLPVTLCRHGAWVGTLTGFIILSIFFIRKNKKEFLRFLPIPMLHTALYIIIYGIMLNALNVQNTQPNAMWGTPLDIIAGAATEGIEFDEEDTADMERLMPVSEWAECYNKYWTDSIGRHWGTIGPERFARFCDLVDNDNYGLCILRINAKLLLKHPVTWMKAFLGASNLVWQISRPADFVPEAMPYNFNKITDEYDDITYRSFHELTIKTIKYYYNFPYLHTLFFRGGISFCILIISVIVFWVRKQKRYIVIAIPILIYSLTLCLAIPASDARYILPELESAILVLSIMHKRC